MTKTIKFLTYICKVDLNWTSIKLKTSIPQDIINKANRQATDGETSGKGLIKWVYNSDNSLFFKISFVKERQGKDET